MSSAFGGRQELHKTWSEEDEEDMAAPSAPSSSSSSSSLHPLSFSKRGAAGFNDKSRRRAALRAVKVTGVAGQVASTAASKTVSVARFFRKHGKWFKNSATSYAHAAMQYVGLAESDETVRKRREDKLRWRRLREQLLELDKDHSLLEYKHLPAAYCPITQAPMSDPVISPDGHTFDRKAIEMWLQHSQTNPMTRNPLRKEDLVSNIALRDAMKQVRVATTELARIAATSGNTKKKGNSC